MFGTIVDIHIPKKDGVCRGFVFVRYKQVKDDEFLLNSNPKIVIGGQKITLARAQRSNVSRSSTEREGITKTISLSLKWEKGKQKLHESRQVLLQLGEPCMLSTPNFSFKGVLLGASGSENPKE